MKEYICEKCNQPCLSSKDLSKHLSRKYPCDGGKFQCKECDKRFNSACNLSTHKKTCKGRYLSRTVLEEKASKVHDLEQEIASLNSKIFVDDLENEAADDDIQEVNNDIEMPSPLLKTPKLSLETIEDTDIKNNQVYFFECGPLLKPFVDTEAVLIKFGSTDQPYTRLSTHKRDFGGGRLIDSILTNNPKSVESDLKKWLRITGKTVKCKTDKKAQ